MIMSEAIYALNTQVVRIENNIAYDINGNEIAYDKIAVENLVASEAYKTKRAAEYPSFIDYLDGIVKGDNVQVQAYIDACNAVKNKYPKGAA